MNRRRLAFGWELIVEDETFGKLKPFNRGTGNLNAVIDIPKGSCNKYAFRFDVRGYRLKSVLPEGAVFPFDFGSIPGTLAEDGDPTDDLLLMDDPAFAACLVVCRVLGVIEAEQTEKGTADGDNYFESKEFSQKLP